MQAIPFPLPPLAEQRRICEKLDDLLSVVVRLDVDLESNRERCQQLRKAILKWAFEGRLAGQDPNDEPAFILLERIKAERGAADPKNQQRGTRKKQVRA